MIYTVTLNPSLDYIVKVPGFVPGRVSRTEEEKLYPGGKGINVSIMLAHLGVSSIALGFVAGFTGGEVTRCLHKQGCACDFIQLEEGITRINVKLKAQQESDINGQGPNVTKEALNQLFTQLNELKQGDMLVLAGSIPAGLPDDIYEKILSALEGKGISAVVDTTGNLLLNVLKYRPFLIKPNHHELGELFGVEIQSVDQVAVYAKKLQDMGARNVLVSMAGDGAVLLDENGNIMQRKPPRGKVVNSVGAGDSMVAGFIAGYLKDKSYQDAFFTGLAAGSASAFEDWLAEKNDVDELLKQIKE